MDCLLQVSQLECVPKEEPAGSEQQLSELKAFMSQLFAVQAYMQQADA